MFLCVYICMVVPCSLYGRRRVSRNSWTHNIYPYPWQKLSLMYGWSVKESTLRILRAGGGLGGCHSASPAPQCPSRPRVYSSYCRAWIEEQQKKSRGQKQKNRKTCKDKRNVRKGPIKASQNTSSKCSRNKKASTAKRLQKQQNQQNSNNVDKLDTREHKSVNIINVRDVS